MLIVSLSRINLMELIREDSNLKDCVKEISSSRTRWKRSALIIAAPKFLGCR